MSELLEQSRNVAAEAVEASQPVAFVEPSEPVEPTVIAAMHVGDEEPKVMEPSALYIVDSKPNIFYARVKLSDAARNQGRSHDSSYDDDLKQMAMEVLKREAPIRDDVLARQIARAHGFARTGANIRSRILGLLGDVISTEESTGRFLWSGDSPQPIVNFRPAQSDDDRRSIDENSLAELSGVVQQHRELLAKDDPAVAIARSLGLGRLSQSSRERIEAAIRLGCDDA